MDVGSIKLIKRQYRSCSFILIGWLDHEDLCWRSSHIVSQIYFPWVAEPGEGGGEFPVQKLLFATPPPPKNCHNAKDFANFVFKILDPLHNLLSTAFKTYSQEQDTQLRYLVLSKTSTSKLRLHQNALFRNFFFVKACPRTPLKCFTPHLADLQQNIFLQDSPTQSQAFIFPLNCCHISFFVETIQISKKCTFLKIVNVVQL